MAVFFTIMNVYKEANKILEEYEGSITEGMTDTELAAYRLGITNMTSLLKSLLVHDETFVVHHSGYDVPTEADMRDLERMVDAREYYLESDD
jgi:hypothetical protein